MISSGSSIAKFCLFLLCMHSVNAITAQIFIDYLCRGPSTLTPTVDVPLNTCILTPGAYGLEFSSAVCDDGTAVQFNSFRRAPCGDPDGSDATHASTGYCHSFNSDMPIPGFVAYCGSAKGLQITSTTRVAVATNLASQIPASGATSTSSGGTSSNTQAASSPTDSSEQANKEGWSSLSYAERTGIIVAIVGVFVTAIGIYVAITKR